MILNNKIEGTFSSLRFTFFLSGDRGMLELRRTTDFGKTIKTVASKIYSFGVGGRFLFASVMTGKVSTPGVQITAIYCRHGIMQWPSSQKGFGSN